MRIAFYGGSFDPPHIGHVSLAQAALECLSPDKLLICPDCVAPHKDMAEGGASARERLEMCRLSFGELPRTEVSDIEVSRGGKSYTSDTLREIMRLYPEAELVLLVGTDMLLSFQKWHEAEWMLQNAILAVFPREDDDGEQIESASEALHERFGARIICVEKKPLPMASTDVRAALRDRSGRASLTPDAYAYVIKHRIYGAKPELEWLREQAKLLLKPKRVPHVLGCEQEAVQLARRWGASEEDAAEAGILHDITKKLELNQQLILCEKYGIMTDNVERASTKLLHAKTGAALARDMFGVSDEVYSAISWHTTGRPDMTTLEKVLYMADYIEPTRDFDGVETLRDLAYKNLDAAMVLGLEMSLEDVNSRGEQIHKNTADALEWYKRGNT